MSNLPSPPPVLLLLPKEYPPRSVNYAVEALGQLTGGPSCTSWGFSAPVVVLSSISGPVVTLSSLTA